MTTDGTSSPDPRTPETASPESLADPSAADGPSHDPEALATASCFEETPLTRPEYLNVMVHFYRAEVGRSTSWRQRLDATTNWAVLTSAGMLSFTFATTNHSHVLLLLSNLIIVAYLLIEARRFRFFEVYRARVRMIEENMIQPVITRRLRSPKSQWGQQVAADLDRPKYKTTFIQAVGFRLRRNYIFIFSILLGGWVLKLAMHPRVAGSFGEIYQRVGFGGIPSIAILVGGLVFYLGLAFSLWQGRGIHGSSPSDEIVGLEARLEGWKL